MVDVLGAYTFALMLVTTGSILLSFRARPDFTGLGTGIALATAINYLARNYIWGLVQGVI